MTNTQLAQSDSISATYTLLNKKQVRTTSFGTMESDTSTLALQTRVLTRGMAVGEECYAIFRFPDDLSKDNDLTFTATFASTVSESSKTVSTNLGLLILDDAGSDIAAAVTGTVSSVDATYPESNADQSFVVTFTAIEATYLTAAAEGLAIVLGRIASGAEPTGDLALVNLSVTWTKQRELTD